MNWRQAAAMRVCQPAPASGLPSRETKFDKPILIRYLQGGARGHRHLLSISFAMLVPGKMQPRIEANTRMHKRRSRAPMGSSKTTAAR